VHKNFVFDVICFVKFPVTVIAEHDLMDDDGCVESFFCIQNHYDE
jgi:hypothetical protein